MSKKTCNNCKVDFPRTIEYFFVKTIKQINKKGVLVEYKSFRHLCKKCYGKNHASKHRKKRCKELNCEESNYKKVVYKIIADKKTKFKQAKKELNITEYRNLLLLTRKLGYEFTTVEQFLEDRSNNKFRFEFDFRKRKMKYPKSLIRVNDLPKDEFNKIRNEYNNTALPDGVVANRMKLKLDQCPKELIEMKRNIIKLNQILNK